MLYGIPLSKGEGEFLPKRNGELFTSFLNVYF
jgi:hypothetical protein